MDHLPIWAISAAASAMGAMAQPPEAARVTGLGGFFFASEDPSALAAWYKESFGITGAPRSYDARPWMQEAGPTVFEPFPADFPAFADGEAHFMLNFRTLDLDGLVAHLRAGGNAVEVDPETYPNGRFATVRDPEGNPIQLWQPAE